MNSKSLKFIKFKKMKRKVKLWFETKLIGIGRQTK